MAARKEKAIFIGGSLGDKPVQRHHAVLGATLAGLGYQVSLIVHGSNDTRDNLDDRISVLRWPSPRPTRLADARFLNRILTTLNPCCVVGNFGSNTLLMTLGAMHRVPVRIHWHHTLSTAVQEDSPKNKRFRLWLLRHRAKLVYRMATHTVANSLAAKQDLTGTYRVPPAQCTVLWNCLQDPLMGFPVESGRLRHGADSQRFMCVGRFNPCKGQDILLRAVAIVTRHLPQITVEFVGDGPTRNLCERLARDLGVSDRCSFAGTVPHRQVLLKMAGARATIVPSRAEAFGFVNIESMAVGTPVIGSDTGGIAEIVRDRLDGLLFPVGNPDALARCIVELAESASFREAMSVSARQRYLDHFELFRAVAAQAQWVNGLINAAS